MKKNMLICLACCGLLHTHVDAQSIGPSIVASAGGGGTIGGQSFDFAVGEMTLVNTLSASNIVVTQGVLQPHPPLTGIATVQTAGKSIRVYPNPATDHIWITPQFDTRSQLFIAVYDIAGKKLIENGFAHGAGSGEHRLDIRSLASGQYLLIVDLVADGETSKYGFNVQVVK